MNECFGVNELRKMFLDYFEKQGHLVMKSFSLVPRNDKSLLLINAGMAPLKPYFTGQEVPPRKRVATCQKCIRTGDIENVGKTARHGTFFEMLGNFSFGDYFKKEAIHWSWEFLTDVVGLSKDRLYPSVYETDDEAFEIWNKQERVPVERIYRFGKEDNFWEHGAGPCGPCSEIYYDRGKEYGCGKPDCKVGCDCDRFIEVWNNVFTQFENDGKGNYTELKNKNIDTGMGLERLAVVVQNVDSIFAVDTIKALLDKVGEIAGVSYKEDEKKDISLRLITDHIRSVTFMISDGIMPSNEGRGYVLRRLLRRAARHGRLLGINGKFLADLSKTVIDLSKDGYPELFEHREMIFKVLSEEEEKFNRTIDQGLSILKTFEEEMVSENRRALSGENAFKLYDTYGFPLDLTKEILEEKGFSVDEDGFMKAMEQQRQTARSARNANGPDTYMGAEDTVFTTLDAAVTTNFVGYDKLEDEDEILFLTVDNEKEGKIISELSDTLAEGQNGVIITGNTPFYASMGGQQGDIGLIECENGVFRVKDTVKLPGDKTGHVGVVESGLMEKGKRVSLKVDRENRALTARNHSATHLLQRALRDVLGTHVEQAGSLVNAEHLRFDFTHFSAMTKEEIKKVENMVNEAVLAAYPVITDVMGLDEAKKTGAMAHFEDKYGESVRVVSMGDFSKELCGGTHVRNTGEITAFKILSESGIAAGVRRIEAITSKGFFSYFEKLEEEMVNAAKAAKTEPKNLERKIISLQEEIKSLQGENQKLKDKAANDSVKDVMDNVKEVKGVKFLAVKLNDVDMNGLRNLGDQLKTKLGEGVVLLAAEAEGKVNLLSMATDNAVKSGAHAGNLIKGIAPLVGGGGGGKPNMAQAGGKNPSGIEKAFETALTVLEEQIK